MKETNDMRQVAEAGTTNNRAEINDALVPVLGFSQTLLRDPEVSDPLRREFLIRIANGASRLAHLINLPTDNERNEQDGNNTTD